MMEVVCIGNMVADIVGGKVNSFPNIGESLTVDNMQLCIGGCCCNTAIALSRLGVETKVFGKIGKDIFGDFITNKLIDEGIDTLGVSVSETSNTSSTMVIVNNSGERTFIHQPGANDEFSINDIQFESLKDAKIVHIAGTFSLGKFDGIETEMALKKFKEMNIVTSLDTSWDSSNKWMKSLGQSLKYIDIFMPSLNEAKMLSGKSNVEDMAEYFLKLGVGTIVIKLGTEGSFAATKNEMFYEKPFIVDAVDSTGAGDSFVAGYLKGTLEGLSIKECLKLGNAAGALCVMCTGTCGRIKDYKALKKFINI